MSRQQAKGRNQVDVVYDDMEYLRSEMTVDVDAKLALKADKASPTFTGTVTLPSTTSIGNVDSTELGYLDNLTGNVQTQLNGKAASVHGHSIGDVSGLQGALDAKNRYIMSASYIRSAAFNINTASPLRIGGWTRAWGDLPVGTVNGGIDTVNDDLFFFPGGTRWLISYCLYSDSALDSGCYIYCEFGQWFGAFSTVVESRTYQQGHSGFAGAGQVMNNCTFIVDPVTTTADCMQVLGQTAGVGRTVYQSTIQFARLR